MEKAEQPCANAAECALAAEVGLRLAETFCQRKGHLLPKDQVEFASILAMAFLFGRESIAGVVPP